jgi:hypothetical protein
MPWSYLPRSLLELVWSWFPARVQCRVGNIVCSTWRQIVKRGPLRLSDLETGAESGSFEPEALFMDSRGLFANFECLVALRNLHLQSVSDRVQLLEVGSLRHGLESIALMSAGHVFRAVARLCHQGGSYPHKPHGELDSRA